MKKDPYKVLGVSPMASDNDIKKAFRKKSKLHNQNLNEDLKSWGNEKFKEELAAYNILSDQEKRKEYDDLSHLQLKRVRKKILELNPEEQKKEGPSFKESSSLLDRIKSIFSKPKKVQQKNLYDPKKADMHFTLGLSLCDNIKFLEQSPNEFKKVLEYDPNHIEAYYNLGIVYYKLGQFEEALIYFQKVLTGDKTHEDAKKMISLLKDDTF